MPRSTATKITRKRVLVPPSSRKSKEEVQVAKREGARIEADLLKARRAAWMQIYLELGPGRTVPKAMEAGKERLGAIGQSTMMQWCAQDKWVEKARELDNNATVQTIRRASDLVELKNMDVIEALHAVGSKALQSIIDGICVVRTPQEARAMAQVAADVFKLREALMSPESATSKARSLTQINNTTINMSGAPGEALSVVGPARQALLLLEKRLKEKPAVVVDVIDAVADEVAKGDQVDEADLSDAGDEEGAGVEAEAVVEATGEMKSTFAELLRAKLGQ